MLVVHFHVIVFVEGATGGFIAPFVVKHLEWSNRDSALIAAVFQGALGIGRFVNIGIASLLSPRSVLIMNLSATLGAYIIMTCFLTYSDIVIWVSVAMAGFFQSSTFPTSMLWASNYIHVTGTASGLFLLGSSSASFIYPNLIGGFFNDGAPMNMLYLILSVAVVQIIVFVCMQVFAIVASRRSRRKKT
jgi:fucose permease